MIVRWHGQSAFTLTGHEHTVAIDPFGVFPPDVSARFRFAYPPIEPHAADLLLVTHEHRDHNAVEVVTGDPQRDPLDGRPLRVARRRGRRGRVGARRRGRDDPRPEHDLRVLARRRSRRPSRRLRPGRVYAPSSALRSGTSTSCSCPWAAGRRLDAEAAAGIVRELDPAFAIPMHYRTPALDFLEPPDRFLALFDDVAPRRAAASGPCPASGLRDPDRRASAARSPEPVSSDPCTADLPVVHLLVVRRPLLALQADVLGEDVVAERLAHDVVGLERVERVRRGRAAGC